jgi:hypothetical protein
LLTLRSTPNLEDQASVFISPGDRVASYTPSSTPSSKILSDISICNIVREIKLCFNKFAMMVIIFISHEWKQDASI